MSATISRHMANAVIDDVADAVDAVLKKHGLSLDSKSGSYRDHEMSVKLSLKINDPKAAADSFARDARLLGLPEKALGMTVVLSGNHYEITGIKLNNRKYPVIATRRENGKSYKLPVDDVKRNLIMPEPEAPKPTGETRKEALEGWSDAGEEAGWMGA